MAGLLLSVVLSGRCAAQTTLDGQFGLTQAVLSKKHQPWAIGPGTSLGVTTAVSEKARLRLGVTWRRLWDDTASNNTVKLPHPDDRAARAWTQTMLTGAVEYPLGGPESLALFGSAGLGLSFWQIEGYPGYNPLTVKDEDGDDVEYKSTEAVLSLTVGFQPHLLSSLHLRAQIGVDYFTGIGPGFAEDVNDERSRAQLTLGLGLMLPLQRGVRTVSDPYDVSVPSVAYNEPEGELPRDYAAKQPSGDADGDGVFNQDDQCPQTPPGAIVDRHGCPLDEDADGVFDGLDRCPGTPQEQRETVDVHGCPVVDTAAVHVDAEAAVDTVMAEVVDEEPDSIPAPAPAAISPDSAEVTETAPDTIPTSKPEIAATDTTEQAPPAADTTTETTTAPTENQPPVLKVERRDVDSDGDGVLDSKDRCPNTLRGLPVDRHGCLVMTELQRRLVLHVSYLPGTTAPDRTSLAVLDDLIVRLKRTTDVEILVEGFTDNIGIDADNLAVSQKRADRIKAYLVRKGIDAARITAVGRGETKFIASNNTAAGRQKNRRIEISFHRP
jgi:outer membrane protein OmpA-like peptidoglycan-associated protein